MFTLPGELNFNVCAILCSCITKYLSALVFRIVINFCSLVKICTLCAFKLDFVQHQISTVSRIMVMNVISLNFKIFRHILRVFLFSDVEIPNQAYKLYHSLIASQNCDKQFYLLFFVVRNSA